MLSRRTRRLDSVDSVRNEKGLSMTSVLYCQRLLQPFVRFLAIASIAALFGCQPSTATNPAKKNAAPGNSPAANSAKETPAAEVTGVAVANRRPRICLVSRPRCKRFLPRKDRRNRRPKRGSRPRQSATKPLPRMRSRPAAVVGSELGRDREVVAQAGRESGRRGQRPGRYEAVLREAGGRRETRHGADPRRNVQDGQPRQRKGSRKG